MIVAFSQMIIIICIVLFCIFRIISVFFFKETYNTKEIKIKDSRLAWKIISNKSTFHKWWSKFHSKKRNALPAENVITLEYMENNMVKYILNNTKSSNEIWTFYFKNNKVIVKKQSLALNRFKDFLNKYCLNKKDLKKFTKDFKGIYEYSLKNKKSRKTKVRVNPQSA